MTSAAETNVDLLAPAAVEFQPKPFADVIYGEPLEYDEKRKFIEIWDARKGVVENGLSFEHDGIHSAFYLSGYEGTSDIHRSFFNPFIASLAKATRFTRSELELVLRLELVLGPVDIDSFMKVAKRFEKYRNFEDSYNADKAFRNAIAQKRKGRKARFSNENRLLLVNRFNDMVKNLRFKDLESRRRWGILRETKQEVPQWFAVKLMNQIERV